LWQGGHRLRQTMVKLRVGGRFEVDRGSGNGTCRLSELYIYVYMYIYIKTDTLDNERKRSAPNYG